MSKSSDDWSPADNPYAIALSQAQLWQSIVALTINRMREPDDGPAGWFDPAQLDAHVLVLALRQMLVAEELEQAALIELDMAAEVRDELAEARTRFEDALPGIKDMRDGLTHFDDWSRGRGRGPQARRVQAGEALRDVARDYAGFAYHRNESAIQFGPYTIEVDASEAATFELSEAIYRAAHQVDLRRVTELRDRIVRALNASDVDCGEPDSAIKLSPGTDLRIWLSLNTTEIQESSAVVTLARRTVAAIEASGLSLMSDHLPGDTQPIELLIQGHILRVDDDH